MIKIRQIFTASMTGIIVSIGSGVDAVPTELTVEEINSIAKQTTVLIAPRLTEDELNDLLKRKPVKKWTVGSGVIIAKEGEKYYVLTVTHNFNQEQVNINEYYGIMTSDKKVNLVTKINDGQECTNGFLETIKNKNLKATLVRFGCFESQKIYGYDLAIVSFKSEKNYPVASLGNASQLKEGDKVYISGWPKIEAEPKLKPDGTPQLDSEGKIICKDPEPQRQRQLVRGLLEGSIPVTEEDNGYSLYYTDRTRPGMSGGPVLDSYGRLVGIHGRGSANKLICGQIYQPISNNNSSPKNPSPERGEYEPFPDFEPNNNLPQNQDKNKSDSWRPFSPFESQDNLENDVNNNQNNNQNNSDLPGSDDSSSLISQLKTMYSSAQNIDYSQQLIKQFGMNLAFKLEVPSQSLIESEITKIPNEVQEGVIDTGDKIDNIYELFDFDLDDLLREKGTQL